MNTLLIIAYLLGSSPEADAAAALALARAARERVVVPETVAAVWYTESDYASAVKEGHRTGKPVFVLFVEPIKCVLCKRLEAGALKDQAVVDALKGFVCVKIDVTSADGRSLEKVFNVQSYPTIIVYREDTHAGQATGNVGTEELMKLLQPVDVRSVPPPPATIVGWNSQIPFPPGMKPFTPTAITQRIAVTNDRDTIQQAQIRDLESKWHGSGGMVGLTGWKSEKFKNEIANPVSRIANISVLNSLGYFQNNRGIVRTYPDGTRFDDVLSNTEGTVFEHRSREKKDGKWKSSVLFTDETARPKGYTGLTVSCASCHNQAGSGGYATGLIPGGDTVLSDPLDWSLVRR